MQTNTDYARTVDVTIEQTASGLFVAHSQSLPGLSIASRDLEAIKDDVPNVIRALYEHQGLEVFVLPLDGGASDEEFPKTWVATPAYLAQEAMRA